MRGKFDCCKECGCELIQAYDEPILCDSCCSWQRAEKQFEKEFEKEKIKYENKIKELENKLKELNGEVSKTSNYFLICDQRDKAFLEVDQWKQRFFDSEHRYNRLILQIQNILNP